MYIRQSPLCAATAHIRGRSLQAKEKNGKTSGVIEIN